MNGDETYYITREKPDGRWTAWKISDGRLKPEVKKGYEIKGPYPNLIYALMAANERLRPNPISMRLN